MTPPMLLANMDNRSVMDVTCMASFQSHNQKQQQHISVNIHSNKNYNNSNNSLTVFKMQSMNTNANAATPTPTATTPARTAAATTTTTSPTSLSPPDFDFNMPCGYFKSTFARSLSLNNAGNYQCKSLDYDVNNYRQVNASNNKNNNNSNNNNYDNENDNANDDINPNVGDHENCPPLPQRLNRAAAATTITTTPTPTATTWSKNAVNSSCNGNIDNIDNDMPPAIPARRQMPVNTNSNYSDIKTPHQQQLQQQQQQQQPHQQLTQFRRHSTAMGNANTLIAAAHGNFNKVINHIQQQHQLNKNQRHHHYHHNHNHHQPQQQQQQQQQLLNNTKNFSRNVVFVWPNDNIDQQDFDYNIDGEVETNEMTTPPDSLVPPQPSSLTMRTIEQQPLLPPQRPLSIEQVHDQNAALNVEAVLLQNQVDTLQWQLKQVETNCEMYRAVMEEVGRFFERYNAQKLQQQQQQKPPNRSNMERSKSLYHVYMAGAGAGGLEHNQSDIELPSSAYLRARSSTNLIDLKHGNSNTGNGVSKHNKTIAGTPTTTAVKKLNGDNHNHSHNLSYNRKCVDDLATTTTLAHNNHNGYKDYTWRRTPKKYNGNESRSQTASETAMEIKLNQEAFRLSRTIQNLLHTSRQQADLIQHNHNQQQQLQQQQLQQHPQRNSISSFSLHRLGQTPSVPLSMPMHNSTMTGCVNTNANDCSTTSTTSSASSTASSASLTSPLASATTTPSPTTKHTTTSLATAGGTTADMLFLRANTMRDSRLSLRSSTDGSVHSTISSAASSSSSSKFETDEESNMYQHIKAATTPAATAVGGTIITTKTATSTPTRCSKQKHQHHHQAFLLGSTTEDESGFSSISSFQDIGLPLSSTMLSHVDDRHAPTDESTELPTMSLKQIANDNCNSTLKATAATTTTPLTPTAGHPNNVVGLPLQDGALLQQQQQQPHAQQTHRWDNVSKTYRNANKYQRFSTLSNEDSATVLWV